MSLSVITAVRGRHRHLRRMREGLAACRPAPDRHIVVSMGDPGAAAVASAAPGPSKVVELPAEEGARQLAGATDFLLDHDKVTSRTVGAIGFCMGGGFVLALAAQQGEKISAALPFYGVGQAVPETYTGVKAAVQGHYANQDEMYPPEKARQQEAQIREESGAEVEFFYYDAGHAFHNDENLIGTYDAEKAQLAWERSVTFLKEKVV